MLAAESGREVTAATVDAHPGLRLLARVALGIFALIGVWLAVAPAVVGSKIVLATAGGSPDWLLGVWRFAGADVLAGENAGWTYYSVLMCGMAVYALLVALAPQLSMRALWTAVIGLHVVFFLAPPLLSQDVFSYVAYARLGVEHDLNPYSHRPFDIPADPVFGYAGSKDAVNVYGPFFTLVTYPLAWLSVPAAFWVLKGVAAAASLGLIRVVDEIAQRVGVDRRRAIVVLGLCPATLVHVVGGAHNEALVMLLVFGGISLALGERERVGGFVSAAALGVKASALVPLPFMLVATRERWQMLAGMAAAGVLTVVVGVVAFGGDALNSLNLISSNQDRTSRYSIPQVTVDGLGRVFGSLDHGAAIDAVRGVMVLVLGVAVVWLLHRSWRRPETWLANAGWATLGVLIASAWLVPWYLLWLLPFAAVTRCRALIVASVVFAGYAMAIAIPF
ncbi:MAG: polyprenol phosphomannose-dependent alpha 1,6 mannosyltransferase MptB [Solirubrobacterales bacterium]